MGVSGLLKALGDVQREVHVSEYRGKCVGLDAHCFLHKGKYACAEALLKGQPTTAYLQPLLDVVSTLLAQGVEPFAVFDGGPLPVKREAEQARQRARELAQWRAGALLRSGGDSSQAAKHLGSAVGVTPEMAAQGMNRLRQLGVRCLVAPCEADAQLAHLALTGRVQACATEDVDLLAFGCERVIFGLTAGGFGREIQLADVGRSRGLAPYRVAPESLPDLCVFSGCDYLPAIPRLGLKTASQLLHRSRGDVSRAVHLARREGFQVPEGYERNFLEARLAYLSQTVFGVEEGGLRPLRPLPAGVEVTPGCLGPAAEAVPDALARGVAEGRLNPATLEPFAGAVLAGQADLVVSAGAIASDGCEMVVAATASSSTAGCGEPARPRLLSQGPPQCLSQRALQEETWARRRAASLQEFEEAASGAASSQVAEVLADFRPPRRTASWRDAPEAPAAPPLGAGCAGEGGGVGGGACESAGEGGSCGAQDSDSSAAGAESQSPQLAAAAERRSNAVPFRPPRLLAGASPGTAEALGESLAKRRRLGCRVAA